MKSFDEFFKENFEDGLSDPSKYILKFTFEAGQQSKQAEIDELRKRLTMYEREGYKLVPVVDTDAMWSAGRAVIEDNGYSADASDVYKAMIGACDAK